METLIIPQQIMSKRQLKHENIKRSGGKISLRRFEFLNLLGITFIICKIFLKNLIVFVNATSIGTYVLFYLAL